MPVSNEELAQLIQKNIEATETLQDQVRGMRRGMRFSRAWSIIKVLIIVVPLVWGYFVIRPFVADANELWKELFAPRNGANSLQSALELQKLLEIYK